MFATINGARIAFEEAGSGDPMVFVHGLGGTLHVWWPVAQQLTAQWKVIAYDSRGCGRSQVTPPPYTIDALTDDLISLLDAARIDKAIVCGHSSGSLVAQRFAQRESARAAGLVLVGAISRFAEEARNKFKARAAATAEGGIDAFVDQFVKGAFHPQTNEQLPQIASLTRDVMLRNDRDAYIAAINGLLEAPDIDRSTITCPTLVLVGDEDHATPKAMADELGATIPNASVQMVATAGHWCTLERPKEMASQIQQFFSK